MGIIEVAVLGEKEHGRPSREGKGGKQGFDLSLAPAWPHGELQSMKSTLENLPFGSFSLGAVVGEGGA